MFKFGQNQQVDFIVWYHEYPFKILENLTNAMRVEISFGSYYFSSN